MIFLFNFNENPTNSSKPHNFRITQFKFQSIVTKCFRKCSHFLWIIKKLNQIIFNSFLNNKNFIRFCNFVNISRIKANLAQCHLNKQEKSKVKILIHNKEILNKIPAMFDIIAHKSSHFHWLFPIFFCSWERLIKSIFMFFLKQDKRKNFLSRIHHHNSHQKWR